MSAVHEIVGFVVVTVFATGWVWGLGAAIAKRGPGERYWTWLAVAQIVAGLQAVLGLILLVMGRRPTTWLHYVYGFGPLMILLLAHGMAREGQKVKTGVQPVAPWIWFAVASFICFGLSLRALMTGLGVG
jgi:hypothetical protein